jgi:hypothetical protein
VGSRPSRRKRNLEPRPHEIAIPPLQIRVDDRFTDEAGEWEIEQSTVARSGGNTEKFVGGPNGTRSNLHN